MGTASQGMQTAWRALARSSCEEWPGNWGVIVRRRVVKKKKGCDTSGLQEDLGFYSSVLGKPLEDLNQRSDVICFTFLKAQVGCSVEP